MSRSERCPNLVCLPGTPTLSRRMSCTRGRRPVVTRSRSPPFPRGIPTSSPWRAGPPRRRRDLPGSTPWSTTLGRAAERSQSRPADQQTLADDGRVSERSRAPGSSSYSPCLALAALHRCAQLRNTRAATPTTLTGSPPSAPGPMASGPATSGCARAPAGRSTPSRPAPTRTIRGSSGAASRSTTTSGRPCSMDGSVDWMAIVPCSALPAWGVLESRVSRRTAAKPLRSWACPHPSD
jgi:hypothetical protein